MRLFVFLFLLGSVLAEPNAVIAVLIKPFQNGKYLFVVFMIRIYGKIRIKHHRRQVLSYILHQWGFDGYGLPKVFYKQRTWIWYCDRIWNYEASPDLEDCDES